MPGPLSSQEMQPWQPVVLLALLLGTLATSAPLANTAVSRNLRTLELLLSHTSNHQEQKQEDIIRQKRGPRCLLHCLAMGRLHPAQCHQLC